jgi:hypothetical protein
MQPSELADELARLSKQVRRGGKLSASSDPAKAVAALAELSAAAVDLIPVQRDLADLRDVSTVRAIGADWGGAAALAAELGVTAQAVSKWRKRGERLLAGETV